MIGLLVPLLPGILWLAIVYRTDSYEPEPKRYVFLTFALGILAILPAFLVETAATTLYPMVEGDALSVFLLAFLVVGPVEELAKFLAVRWSMFRSAEFNEPLDGIIYASAAALGFASLENVLYVIDFRHGLSIRWSMLGARAFFALPGHLVFASVWGYALGRSKFDPAYRVWPRVMGAAALHGLYDFLVLYPPTRPLLLFYLSVMVPIFIRQLRALRDASPFSPQLAASAETKSPDRPG